MRVFIKVFLIFLKIFQACQAQRSTSFLSMGSALIGEYNLPDLKSVKRYYLSTSFKSHWTGANAFCAHNGMELATLESKDESISLLKLSNENIGKFGQLKKAFIGGISPNPRNKSGVFWFKSAKHASYDITVSQADQKSGGGAINDNCYSINLEDTSGFSDEACTQKLKYYYSFVCQKVVPTKITTTVATTTVKPICPTSYTDIILASDGSYLKTSCIVFKNGNYSQAIESCAKYGMKLFVVEDANTQTQLNKTLKTVWPDGSGVSLWIEGVKDLVDNEWYYYSSGKKTPATTDLNWLRGAATDTGCLSTNGADSISFRAMGQNCSYAGYSVFCEHREKASKTVASHVSKPYCPAGCFNSEIKNRDGSRAKTLCVLKDRSHHLEAYDICSYYGMKLFVIDSANTQAQFLKSLSSKWLTPSSDATFWIDGIKNTTDGKWYYYSYGKQTPAFGNLLWQTSAAVETGCLIVSRVATGFKVAGMGYWYTFPLICELK